ncbi:hypothetical protein ACLI4U_06535 [Natrialbaceae archaeon A-CW2]|uniref:hypothetical protein n=1 Tax=Natronosalvus amylolyticus TaxID=2961994 RepID=UPI0020C9792F|nr:hypothetical protein [Natronosalvus amylolyticus]
MARVERSFRGISERLTVRYLERLGGELIEEGVVEGAEWSACFSSETVGIGPSLTLTEVTIVFEGEDSTLEDLVPAFAKKAMRAGG